VVVVVGYQTSTLSPAGGVGARTTLHSVSKEMVFKIRFIACFTL